MDCQRIRLTLSSFQDGRVVESERREIAAHLSGCRDCSLHLAQLEMVRQSLKSASPRPMPAKLHFALRSMASKEAAKRRRYTDFLGYLGDLKERLALYATNMMKPLALPAAGGLASAVLLFSMVMTNFQGIVRQPLDDVPIPIATDATVRSTNLLDFSEAEVTVDVYVDEQGRVIDYSFPDGYGDFKSSTMRRKLENSLLFAEFTPATRFFQPTSGWVRVTFRRSAIDVKG